jgi:micrococcal nuclease
MSLTPSYTYKAIVINIPSANEAELQIACGFKTLKKETVSLPQNLRASSELPTLQIGQKIEVITTKKTGTRAPGALSDYSAEITITPKDYKYIYNAIVTRCIDGDTAEMLIDVGFGITRPETVRLQGINAPELSGTTKTAGEASKRWLENRILGKQVHLKTYNMEQQFEKYGRFLALVYDFGAITTADSVNAASIRAKQSVFYSGHN